MATFITLYGKHRGGGYFLRLCRMISALANRGHRVIYIAPDKFPLSGDNIRFYKAPSFFKGKISYIYFLIASMFMLPAISRREKKIDAIVVFGALYAIPFIFRKFLHNTPLITFIRGNRMGDCKAKKRGLLESWIGTPVFKIGLTISDRVIFNSPSIMKDINQLFRIKQREVLPNDIDSNNFFNKRTMNKDRTEDKWPFHIGYIGNLVRLKNIDLLMISISMLIKRGYDLQLILVGDGPLEKALVNKAEELGIADDCKFLGRRDDINELLNFSIDLLVLPSKTEGAPNVLLEALGTETLCIASDIPPIRDILKFPELLFELDHISLSKKIGRIIDDKEYRFKLLQLCSERRKGFVFDWEDKIVNTIMKSLDPQNRENVRGAE